MARRTKKKWLDLKHSSACLADIARLVVKRIDLFIAEQSGLKRKQKVPNVEALLKLVEILESTPDEAVDLQNWTCGTTACAIGHAATHPWFIERGFKLSDTGYGYPVFHQVNGEKLESWYAVEKFFGLTGYVFTLSSYHSRSFWLFNSQCYPAGKKNNMPHEFYQKQQEVGIRQQVINRIKEFVENAI